MRFVNKIGNRENFGLVYIKEKKIKQWVLAES